MTTEIKFVKHDGSECPVSDNTLVLVIANCGELSSGKAREYDWSFDVYDGDWDIAYYADLTDVDSFIVDSLAYF